jgi:hypothetical protein
MPTPGEMAQVKPSKFREVLGADAVLYVTVLDWSNRYMVVQSETKVVLEYRLVDAGTGQTLWTQTRTITDSQGGLSVPGLVMAAAHAGTNVNAERERDLAVKLNDQVVTDKNAGMLLGFRHPGHAQDQAKRKSELTTAAAQ